MSSTKQHSGFTIVELLVVIVVIAILATISIVSYGAWKKQAATAQVKSDLNGVAAAMESARTFTGVYPATIPATFAASNGVVLAAFGGGGLTYCVDGSSPLQDATVYYCIASESKDQGPLSGTCATRPGVIALGIPTGLVVTSTDAVSVTLSWGVVTNATGYTAQCAQDNGFIVGNQRINTSALTAKVTGLNPGTGIYCEVEATNATYVSAWSSVVSTNTSNLIGWWPLDGNASDQSGSGNNGTVNGATLAIGQNNQANNAYSFNGTSNYIAVPNSSSLQVGDTFTVSAWVYLTNSSGRYGIFTTRTANTTGSWQLEIGTGNGGTGRVAVTGLGTWIWESNNGVININTWYHIVYVKAGNNTQGGSLYLNGVLQPALDTAVYTILNNSDQKGIGVGALSTQYFPGRLDDVRLYSRALSSIEVTSLYAAGAQ